MQSAVPHAYGLPSPPEVFSLILGTVVGFAVVGALAFGGVTAQFEARVDGFGCGGASASFRCV